MATAEQLVELGRKIDADVATQRQAVQQLQKLLLAEAKKRGTPLDLKESPEAQLLWKNISHPSVTVHGGVCGLLPALVAGRCFDWEAAVGGLLNLIPALPPSNLTYASSALVSLVSLFAQNTRPNEPLCPFTATGTPHPLITAITNRPESWPGLVGELRAHLDGVHASTEAKGKGWVVPWGVRWLAMLLPFLKHVLLSSGTGPEILQAGQATQQFLLAATQTHPTCAQWVYDFCLSILPHLNTSPISQTGPLLHLLSSLVSQIGNKERSQTVESTENGSGVSYSRLQWALYEYTVSLCCQQQHDGAIPSLRILDQISRFLPTNTEIPSADLSTGTTAGLAYLLLGACENDAGVILSVMERHFYVITRGVAVMSWGLCAVSFSLLSLLSAGKVVGIQAADLLRKVETIKPDDNQLNGTPPPRVLVYGTYPHVVATVAQAHRLHRTPQSLLTAVSQGVVDNGQVGAPITLGVGSMLLSPHLSVRNFGLQLASALVSADATRAPSLLPVLLYQLSREDDVEHKMAILNAIPKLAANKMSVAPVLRAVRAISSSVGLEAVGLRLMTSLWATHRRTYPYLQAMLTDPPGTPRSWEFQVARASTYHNICTERGEQYGQDTIAWALRTAANEPDPTIAAYALATLAALCRAFVTTVRAVCTALSGVSANNVPGCAREQLRWIGQESRPLVLVRACQLLALTPKFGLPDTAPLNERCMAEEFKMRVLQFLWGATSHADERVCEATFSSLLSFPLEDMLEDYEPIIGQLIDTAATPPPQKKDGETDTKPIPLPSVESEGGGVSAARYTTLLTSPSTGSLPSCQALVQRALAHELSFAYIRKVSTRGAREGHQKTAFYGLLDKAPKALQTAYDSAPNATMRSAMGGALLGVFSAEGLLRGGGKEGQGVGRRERVQAGRQARRLLADMLEDPTPLGVGDWYLRLVAVTSWLSFMDQLLRACVAAEVARAALESNQKITEEDAEQVVMDELVGFLVAASRKNTAGEANATMALGGLVLNLRANVQRVHTLVDTVVATLAHVVAAPIKMHCPLQGVRLEWGIDSGHSPVSAGAQFSAAIVLGSVGRRLVAHTHRHSQFDVSEFLRTAAKISTKIENIDAQWLACACFGGAGVLAGGLRASGLGEGSDRAIIDSVRMTVEDLWQGACGEGPSALGGWLGLGYCVGALAQDPSLHVRLRHLADGVLARVNTPQATDPLSYDGLMVAAAAISVAAFPHGLVQPAFLAQLLKMWNWWDPAYTGPSPTTGSGVALGNLIHGLFSEGYSFPPSYISNLFTAILPTLATESAEIDSGRKTAGLLCLANMLGMERGGLAGGVAPVSSDNDVGGCGKYVEKVAEFLASLQRLASSPLDPLVGRNAGWALGAVVGCHQHGRQAGGHRDTRMVPPSYAHLPPTSLLRCLHEAVASANDGDRPIWGALKLLSECTSLPEVNWATLTLHTLSLARAHPSLSPPPPRQSVGALAVQLLANQASIVGPAAELCALLCEPARYSNLDLCTQQTVAKSLLPILRSVSETLARKILSHLTALLYTQQKERSSPLSQETQSAIRPFFMDGVLSCLNQAESATVVSEITHIFPTLYRLYVISFDPATPPFFPSDASRTLEQLCQCLAAIPMEHVNALLLGTHEIFVRENIPSGKIQTVGGFLRCLLVAKTTSCDQSNVGLGQAWMLECARQLYPCREWLLNVDLGGVFSEASVAMATAQVCALTAATNQPGGAQIRAKWHTDTLDMLFQLVSNHDPKTPGLCKATKGAISLVGLCAMAWGDAATNALFNPLAPPRKQQTEKAQWVLDEKRLAEWMCGGGVGMDGAETMLCELFPRLLATVGWEETVQSVANRIIALSNISGEGAAAVAVREAMYPALVRLRQQYPGTAAKWVVYG